MKPKCLWIYSMQWNCIFYSLTYFFFCRFVSITLVFLNKSLLSGGTSVDAPLFITCFQCTVTAAACYAIVSLPPNVWEAKNLACGQITISIQTLKKVLPLSVVCIDYLSYIVKRNPRESCIWKNGLFEVGWKRMVITYVPSIHIIRSFWPFCARSLLTPIWADSL